MFSMDGPLLKFALKTIWGWEGSKWPCSGHFWPYTVPYMVWDDVDWASSINFLMTINVALTMFVPKSISWNGGAPDGQVQVISGPNMVQYGTDWASSIHFFIGNQYCFTKICPKINIWGWRLSRWPILGHFFPFPAISGPVHGLRWSRLCLNRPFHIGNQCCSTNFFF